MVNELNKDRIISLFGESFEIVKEKVKGQFKRFWGFYPYESEGCCKDVSIIVAKMLRGALVGGWFTTDTQLKPEDMQVPSKYGISTICAISRKDKLKASHWWVELGDLIIDLTVEQYNRFLKEPMESIEIFDKSSEKSKRYEATIRKEGLALKRLKTDIKEFEG